MEFSGGESLTESTLVENQLPGVSWLRIHSRKFCGEESLSESTQLTWLKTCRHKFCGGESLAERTLVENQMLGILW